MKIIHVLQAMQKASGVSSFVGGLTSGLCDLGAEVAIAADPVDDAIQYPIDSRIKFWELSLIDSDLISEYDVVHIHGLWTWDLHMVSCLCTKNKTPVMWSTHGSLAPWAMNSKRWKKMPAWCIWQKRDLLKAKMFHATSTCEEQWIRRLGFVQPCIVAPLGTVVKFGRKPCASTHKTLLFVGRVYPVKALDRLISAFSMVPVVVRKNWRLRIVGPDQGNHMKTLKALSSRLKVESYVEFVGSRYDNDLDLEYASCDCLALVSHSENFGSTVVEALAHGKPCITSVYTPWRELPDRGCGWWVDNLPEKLSETLKEMMSLSDAERRNMGANGRKLVEEKYTWTKIAEQIKNAYDEIVMGKNLGA